VIICLFKISKSLQTDNNNNNNNDDDDDDDDSNNNNNNNNHQWQLSADTTQMDATYLPSDFCVCSSKIT